MSHKNTNYLGLVPYDDEGPELTMDSREIAELTDRSHDRVMKIIRRTMEALRKDPNQFLRTHTVDDGDPVVYYRLPRQEREDVIDCGAAFTEDQDNAIRRRWDQMEARRKGAHIKAYAETLRAERAARHPAPLPPAGMHEPTAPTRPTFNLVVKDGERGVDLRDLHRELGSKKDFSAWTKSRLADFQNGYDYEILLPQTGGASSRRSQPNRLRRLHRVRQAHRDDGADRPGTAGPTRHPSP